LLCLPFLSFTSLPDLGLDILQVYKYERLQPLSYYAAAEQVQPAPGVQLLWGQQQDRAGEALRARCAMLR
jgi:hypothetical protein